MTKAVGKDRVIREVTPFKIKYNDVFHLKNLYVMMHEYLADENWFGAAGPQSIPNNSHMDIEKLYMERHHPKAIHRGGKELWIWWRLKKNPFGKLQDYYEFRIGIDFHGMYLVDKEIIHQGKKLTVQKGELEIEFMPKIVRTDIGQSWKSHWFLKFWQELFEKRIISQDMDKLEKELWREAYQLQAQVKKYLNLRNFIPTPEPFHPTLYGVEGEF